jgi:hypothetical protein
MDFKKIHLKEWFNPCARLKIPENGFNAAYRNSDLNILNK